jgi:hypothetical protein
MAGAGLGAINRLVNQLEQTEKLLGIRKFQGFGGLTRIPRPDAIPLLIKKLGFRNQLAVEAAAQDLRLATGQDFGTNSTAWQRWFQAHRNEKREEWVLARLEAEGYPVTRFSKAARIPILLEALKDQSEEIRLHAYLLFRTLAPNSTRSVRYYPYHGSINARRRALAKLFAWWRSHRREYIARNPEVPEAQKVAREIAVAHPLQRPEERQDFTPEKWRKWEKDVADRYDMLVRKNRGSWLRRGLETLPLLFLSPFLLFLPLLPFLLLFGLLWPGSVRSKRRIVRAYSLSPDYHRQLLRRRHIQEVLEGRRGFGLVQGIRLTSLCMIVGAVIAGFIWLTLSWGRENGVCVLLGGAAGLAFGILLSIKLSRPGKSRDAQS